VLRIDMSYQNYVRVRIMYPLANALVALTKFHIQGRSDMVVMLRYDNVSFFRFICGRIGLSYKECPEGEVAAGEFSFGVELCAFPPKRLHEVKVQTRSVAARFLNFEEAQRAKLQDEASWSGNIRDREESRHVSGLLVEEEEVANSIPKEEERELMHGVQHIDVKEVNTDSGLPPVFGPDGIQQRVSFGTNLASDEEMSTGVSCPTGSLLKFPSAGRPTCLLLPVDPEVSLVKCSGPNRSGEKTKREQSSPYKRPKRLAKDLSKEELEVERTGMAIKNEDQVMLDEVVGVRTLVVIPAERNPLMGPRSKAHQEP
jgi:hypothetical protein